MYIYNVISGNAAARRSQTSSKSILIRGSLLVVLEGVISDKKSECILNSCFNEIRLWKRGFERLRATRDVQAH